MFLGKKNSICWQDRYRVISFRFRDILLIFQVIFNWFIESTVSESWNISWGNNNRSWSGGGIRRFTHVGYFFGDSATSLFRHMRKRFNTRFFLSRHTRRSFVISLRSRDEKPLKVHEQWRKTRGKRVKELAPCGLARGPGYPRGQHCARAWRAVNWKFREMQKITVFTFFFVRSCLSLHSFIPLCCSFVWVSVSQSGQCER